MKRFFWSILMMISVVTAVHASRAFSEPVTVQQPDGTMLTITLYGDEYMSWVTMTDGVLVMETGQGYCVAAINDMGELSATELLAHNPGLRGISEQQACQQQAQREQEDV
jgi:immune inhibitor A